MKYSIVLLYFFALITEEGFLISPCCSLELCIQMGISFLFSIAFVSFLFSAIVRPPWTTVLQFCISFLNHCLLYNVKVTKLVLLFRADMSSFVTDYRNIVYLIIFKWPRAQRAKGEKTRNIGGNQNIQVEREAGGRE